MIELPAIKDSDEEYAEIEKRIAELFKKEIFAPILKQLGISSMVLKNSLFDLVSAIQSGRIVFYRGRFTGRFSAKVSKELANLGAKWDRKQGSWKISLSSLPPDVRIAIQASEEGFNKSIAKIQQNLQKISPKDIADKIQVQDLFDRAIWKMDKKLTENIKKITVVPEMTSHRVEKISMDYENNMKLWIEKWTEEEIIDLRQRIQKSALEGVRYEAMTNLIRTRYDVSYNKAKFLARQETHLFMSTIREARYEEAGIYEYRWQCVAGSPKHPVRPMHKALEGKIFRWDSPPITSPDGRRNNPGQDFNCRCAARPIVRKAK
jgi:SPP1 gp7 family putative phage head morphogenesis protein